MTFRDLSELYQKAARAPIKLVHYDDFPCKEKKSGFYTEFIQDVSCPDCLMKMSRGDA